jgi:outer membrane protein
MQKKSLLAVLALVSSLSFAEFKLGYVDVSKVFNNSKPAQALQAAMKAKLEPKQQELQGLKAQVDAEQAQVQAIEKKTPNMDKLSAADKSKVEKFQRDQFAMQQKYMAYQQYAQGMQDYASALLLSKVNEILKNISDSEDYDLVLTSNQLVYAKAKYDLTDTIIEKLKTVNSDELLAQLKNAEKQQQQQMKK